MSDEQAEAPVETPQAATTAPQVPSLELDPSIVGSYMQASGVPSEAKGSVRMIEEGGEAL